MIKDLRNKTQAGMLDCKKALEASKGDFEKSIEWLRAKGLSSAGKKSDRIAAEGSVTSYIHAGGTIGVLLEVNSETDFVAKNESFKSFCKDLSLHIVAQKPLYVTEAQVPKEDIEKEKAVLKAKALEEGKKEEFLEKILTGQVNKWLSEVCLMNQKFVKDPDVTIDDVLKNTIATLGENIVIRRFVRWELGEGIEKKTEDFAAEVKAQLN
ncbi:MAG: translation elongation factor Ts [Bdellovibrionaceae bacterium]|nr:translation elongation factor Ts [Pseudobdellovibrionaceae bacterium]